MPTEPAPQPRHCYRSLEISPCSCPTHPPHVEHRPKTCRAFHDPRAPQHWRTPLAALLAALLAGTHSALFVRAGFTLRAETDQRM